MHILEKNLKISEENRKKLFIKKISYEKKVYNYVTKDTLIVEFGNFSDIIMIKTNLTNLKGSNIRIEDIVAPQLRAKHNIISNIGNQLKNRDLWYKIWATSSGFDLRVKSKTNMAPWKSIKPVIMPINMPIANVGKMSIKMENEIIKMENARTNAQIEDQEEYENEKDKRMKANELKKEMKRINEEKEKECLKRALSVNDSDDIVNAKKIITEAENLNLFLDGNNIDMENISQENMNADNTSESI